MESLVLFKASAWPERGDRPHTAPDWKGPQNFCTYINCYSKITNYYLLIIGKALGFEYKRLWVQIQGALFFPCNYCSVVQLYSSH